MRRSSSGSTPNHLSILYLRCLQTLALGPGPGARPFNSLFEMPFNISLQHEAVDAAFNSLFEMHVGPSCAEGCLADFLSILYLRC